MDKCSDESFDLATMRSWAHRFGEEEGAQDDLEFGTIKTSWAVLLYQAAVIAYLVFLCLPKHYCSAESCYAFEVSTSEHT